MTEDPAMPATTRRTTLRPPRLLPALAGLLLALLAAQPVLAITWGREARLSADETYRPELLRTGPATAVGMWQRRDGVYQRRTADGGITWTNTVRLVTGITAWASSAVGQQVDLAYVRRSVLADGSVAWRLSYRRSTDGGATWSAPSALTSAASKIADVDVARRSTGEVAVVWTGLTTGKLYVRRSTDGGASFAGATSVASTNNWEPGATVMYRSDPRIALGTGVMYVAYTSKADTIVIRRSTNGGATWSAATTVTTYGSPDYSLLASGSRAIIGYTSTATGPMKAVVRRTSDKGVTWSSGKAVITLETGTFSALPQFAYRDGVLAVTLKYGTPGASPIWHRQSSDFGASWSTRTRVSLVHVEGSDPEPGGIAILDGHHLAGYNENRGEGNEGLWVRRSAQ